MGGNETYSVSNQRYLFFYNLYVTVLFDYHVYWVLLFITNFPTVSTVVNIVLNVFLKFFLTDLLSVLSSEN